MKSLLIKDTNREERMQMVAVLVFTLLLVGALIAAIAAAVVGL